MKNFLQEATVRAGLYSFVGGGFVLASSVGGNIIFGAAAAFTAGLGAYFTERLIERRGKLAINDKVQEITNAGAPEIILDELVKLQALANIYATAESKLLPELNSIIRNAQEFFERVTSKLDEQAGRMAAVNYADMLQKLNKALGKDYYLDIEKNPHLWSNPTKRLEQVELAVAATDKQIVRNIIQLNESQDIDFTIAIDSLIRAADGDQAQTMTSN